MELFQDFGVQKLFLGHMKASAICNIRTVAMGVIFPASESSDEIKRDLNSYEDDVIAVSAEVHVRESPINPGPVEQASLHKSSSH